MNKLNVSSTERRRIRFIAPGYPTFNIYSAIARHTTALGPVLLASVVSRTTQWDVEIIDENSFYSRTVKTSDGYPDHTYLQERFKADVVVLYGGLSSTIPRLLSLAGFYRQQGCVVLTGGQHFFPGNVAEALDAGIDFVSLGEGEKTLCELLDALLNGGGFAEIDGIAFTNDEKIILTPERVPLSVEEIQQLPVPDFSLLRYAKISLYPVSWIRGCCMNCEFCTVKGNVRCPPADYPLTQIVTLYERFGATTFFIVDDLFGQKRDATLEFCKKIAAWQKRLHVKFHFTVQIRLDKAGDGELLRACASRDSKFWRSALSRRSPRTQGDEQVSASRRIDPQYKLFHRAGFLVPRMFIFGYPGNAG